VPDNIEVTELDDITPTRVDQVKSPASGVPVLIMKALNAVGGVDETPDIDGAEHVIQLLARLIQSEAAELAAGCWDETSDIHLLTEAADLVKYFRDRESWGMGDDGDGMIQKELDDFAKEVGEVFIKASRKFSADERKKLAGEGNALEDGSYPIPDADALRRAAILARSGHGNVAAAKRLIAKRAKELGVKNPLAESKAEKDMTGCGCCDDCTCDHGTGTMEKSTATQADGVGPGADYEPDKDADDPETEEDPDGTGGQTDPNGHEVVSKEQVDVIKAAVTEALAPVIKDVEGLKGDMAKVLGTPIPAGIAISVPPAARKTREREELLAKAARADRLSETVTEQDMKSYYRKQADDARAEAAAI
jgi:hypothetical protein